MYDYQMHPTASLLSAFLPHDDKEDMVFENEFHRVVHKFVDSRTFSAFILFTILINTAMLIANTFFVVAVRTGRTCVGSRRVASRRVASRRVASRRVASRRVASRRVASRRVASRRVASRRVASRRVASRRVASRRVASRRVQLVV